jgi:hypothetical protein
MAVAPGERGPTTTDAYRCQRRRIIFVSIEDSWLWIPAQGRDDV